MNSADDLTARIQQIAERARQRQCEQTPEPTSKLALVMQLPLWLEEFAPAHPARCVRPCSARKTVLFGATDYRDLSEYNDPF